MSRDNPVYSLFGKAHVMAHVQMDDTLSSESSWCLSVMVSCAPHYLDSLFGKAHVMAHVQMDDA